MALSALADLGHLEAVRMAMQMWEYGPALHGREFVIRVAQWARQSGFGGKATGTSSRQALAAH